MVVSRKGATLCVKAHVTAPSHVPGTMVCRAKAAWGGHEQAVEPRGQWPVLLLCPWDFSQFLYSPHPGVPTDQWQGPERVCVGASCLARNSAQRAGWLYP